MGRYVPEPFAFETVVVPSGGVAAMLSRTKYLPSVGGVQCSKAIIRVDAGPIISYTIDGTTVGSATGFKITSFMSEELNGLDAIRNFRTTSTSSGTTGKISVTYFR